MAGQGSRFFEAGYKKPKPLIDVEGVPMIQAVVDSLNIDGTYIFIVQKIHSVQYHLLDVLSEMVPGCVIVEIDEPTDGAARTSLAAKKYVDNNNPLIIANSDQIVEWDSSEFVSLLTNYDTIALFKDTDPKWSFAKIDEGLVSEVAEKKVISDNASVGIYGWSRGSDYVKYAEQMINKNIRTNNEFYICPVYNESIAGGNNVIPYFVDQMFGLGTPEDLSKYLKRNTYD